MMWKGENERTIRELGREWFPANSVTKRDGIFAMIRNGMFDYELWTEMMKSLERITPPLSDRETAMLAKVLWLVPILLVDKRKYMVQRGVSEDLVERCSRELQHQMFRLIGVGLGKP